MKKITYFIILAALLIFTSFVRASGCTYPNQTIEMRESAYISFSNNLHRQFVSINGKLVASGTNMTGYNFTPTATGVYNFVIGFTISTSSGAGGYSCTTTVRVNPATNPTISFQKPSLTTVSTTPSKAVELAVSAADSGGDLKSIYICQGSDKTRCDTSSIAKCNTSSCKVNFSTSSQGIYKFYAYSVDKNNNFSGYSSTKTVKVYKTNEAPTVDIELSSTSINRGDSITLTATASDDHVLKENRLEEIKVCEAGKYNACISKKTCSFDGTKIGTCQVTVEPSSNTTYFARAMDSRLSRTSSHKSVSVNQPPEITVFESPTNVFVNESFKLKIQAQDDDTLSRVGVSVCSIATSDAHCNTSILACNAGGGNASCEHDVAISSTGEKKLKFFAIDNKGLTAIQKLTVNVYQPVGAAIKSISNHNPNINDEIRVNALIGQIKTGFRKLDYAVLKVNGIEVPSSKKSFNCQTSVPQHPSLYSTTLHYTPQSSGIKDLAILAKFCSLNETVQSDAQKVNVAMIPPYGDISLSLSYNKNTSLVTVNFTGAALAEKYEVKELLNGRLTQQTEVTALSANFSGKGPDAHGLTYQYCITAANSAGTASRSYCADIRIDHELEVPQATYFTNQENSQSGPYDLTWHNVGGSVNSYKLYGSKGDLTSPSWQLLTTQSNTAFTIDSLELGLHSYRIDSCNSQGQCAQGQITTFSHLPAYIQDAEILQNPLRIQVKGIGFDEIGSANLQSRNTGKVFSSKDSEIGYSFINKNTLEISISSEIKTHFDNGGLVINVNNSVIGAPVSSFVFDEYTGFEKLDLINNNPAVSSNGNIYVGIKSKLYSLDADTLKVNNGWPYTATGEFRATPTVKDATSASGEIVYAGSTNSNVYAFNASGIQPFWITKLRGAIVAEPALDGDILFVGSMDKALYAIDRLSGQKQWHYQFPEGVIEKPVLYGNGLLYVTTQDEQVHILDRGDLGYSALNWTDIDNSLIRESLDKIGNWQPNENQVDVLKPITRLFYALLKRPPTERELTFFAYASLNEAPLNEIVMAFLQSNAGKQNIDLTLDSVSLVNQIILLLFGEDVPVIAGKTKAAWVNELDNGLSIADLIINFISSDQYTPITEVVVNNTIYYFYNYCFAITCNLLADSDNDGISDQQEIEFGFNPIDHRDPFFEPPLLTVDSVIHRKVHLQWSASEKHNSDSVYYQVLERVGVDFNLLQANISENKVALDKGLGTYNFVVRTCTDVAGSTLCGRYSNEQQVTVNYNNLNDIGETRLVTLDRPEQSKLVGSLSLQTTVSGGKAQVAIPITIPKGRKGIQPDVSLNYSSSSAHSLLGVGWYLQTGAQITRCEASFLQDSAVNKVSFTTSDKLCLNGEKLILVSGEYGRENSEYRTARDRFEKIELKGGDSVDVLSYFVSRSKQGLMTYFGLGRNSQHIIASKPYKWKVSKVVDYTKSKNNILYSYYATGGEHYLTDIYYTGENDNEGNRQVKFIYSDRPDAGGYYIGGEFVKASKRLETVSTFINSNQSVQEIHRYTLGYKVSPVSQKSLLSSIEVCSFVNTGQCLPKKVFDYTGETLKYTTSESEDDLFNNDPFYVVRDQILADMNNDGSPDILRDKLHFTSFENGKLVSTKELNIPFLEEYRLKFTFGTLDFNLDGKLDLIGLTENGISIAYLNDDNSGFTTESLGIPLTCAVVHNFNTTGLGEVGYDVTKSYSGNCSVEVYPDNTGGFYLYYKNLSERGLNVAVINKNCPSNKCLDKKVYDLSDEPDFQIYGEHARVPSPKVVDIDNDGDYDLVRLVPRAGNIDDASFANYDGDMGFTVLQIYYNNQTGFGENADFNFTPRPQVFDVKPATTFASGGHQWLDANGDGLMDLMLGYDVYLNQGDRFGPAISTGMTRVRDASIDGWDLKNLLGNHTNGSIRVVDYNQDGLQDLMYMARYVSFGNCLGGGRKRMFCTEGNGGEQAARSDWSISTLASGTYNAFISQIDKDGNLSFKKVETDIEGTLSHFHQIDVNGDGLLDFVSGRHLTDSTFVYRDRRPVSLYYLAQTGNGQQFIDLLEKVEDQGEASFKHLETFKYTPLRMQENIGGSLTNSSISGVGNTEYYKQIVNYPVVSEHSYRNNLGTINKIKYQYGQAVFSRFGLGLLGFDYIYTLQSDQSSVLNTYRFDYPFNGLPENSKLYSAEGTLLENKTITWCEKSNCGAYNNVYAPYEKSTHTVKYDVKGNELGSITVTVNDIDNYGNILHTVQQKSDQYVTQSIETKAVYHAADEVQWWVDKINSSTVSSSISYTDPLSIREGTNTKKWVATSYTWKDNDYRQLNSEIKTADNTPVRSIINYNTYDKYGNVTHTIFTGDSTISNSIYEVQANKHEIIDYTAYDGYFAHTYNNGMWSEVAKTQNWDITLGVVTSEVNANGVKTEFSYNGFGQQTSIASLSSPTIDIYFDWTDNGYKKSTIQDGSPIITEYFDRFNNQVKTELSVLDKPATTTLLSTEIFEYDYLSRLVKHIEPHYVGEMAATTEYKNFDALGRFNTKVVSRSPIEYSLEYNYTGLNTSVTASSVDQKVLDMSYVNSLSGLLLSSTDAAGNTTHHRYDGLGNTILIKDVLGNDLYFNHDGFSNKLWQSDPNSGESTFIYNGLGQLRQQVDAKNNKLNFDYDGLSRVIRRKLNENVESVWVFDSNKLGQLTSEASNNISKVYTYDEHERVITKTVTLPIEGVNQSFEFKNRYHSESGKLLAKRYPSGEIIVNRFDKFGMPHVFEDGNTSNIYHSYDKLTARGTNSVTTHGNGIVESVDYLLSGLIGKVCVSGSAACDQGILVNENYTEFDGFGNLTLKEDLVASVAESYQYDALHRLKQSTRTASGLVLPEFLPGSVINYDYDAAGNILLKSDYATSYRYDGGNTGGPNAVKQVTKLDDTVVTFKYDANGNLEVGDNLTISYNAFNKPVEIQRGGTKIRFEYGPNGARYMQEKTTANNRQSTYYIDSDYELTVTSANQVVTDRVRHYLTPHLIVEHNSSGRLVNYLHKDRLGSTVAITSGSVDVKLDEKRSFDPFGKPRDEFYGDTVAGRLQSNLNDRGFTGHEHLDDVELIHMNGRGYDYNLGRFLSVDPYIQYPENSQSINPYSYILNNPMAGVDPTGYRSSLFRSDDWVTTYNLSTSNTKQINQKSNGVNHQQGDTGTSQSLLVQVGKEFWENADEYGKLILTEAVKQLVKHSPQAFADVSGYSSAQDLVTALETGEVDDLGWVVVGAITSRFGGRVFSNTIRRNPCNKSCFVAGTMVLTDKGYVPIESIGEGDKVLATDIHTGEQSWKPVTHTWVVFDKDIYEVQIKANDGTYQTVEATDSHPFYVVNKGWVETINLTLGDKFINEQGEHYLVTGLRSLDRKDIAYNFTVQDFHTYYVTEKNILVHNCGEKLTESNRVKSDATNTGAQKRLAAYLKHSANWASGSLKGTLDKYAKEIKGELSHDGVKTNFVNEKLGIKVMQDNENNYFRIYDINRKTYLDASGNIPKTGALRGKEAKNFLQEQTHIRNTD
ncbi:hypothetical protein N474_22445 [Pseudoalteromonas luteoviolacea CPMOR-2]|uniref:polymorphic toxin-type HINT domain-containing protein n=1 Tax=Pseudoalteromonas luteoviolacea TaxID=43657 RepID=UPI0007B076EF|nr:polymorphic toxin-type HINT domain-containing protein [Pseudoalteromonas luteoviolacea]KZN52837.1 hypothetical protein N474_22445 [Pseudoalteromonas luteoviolacea CPMOR-2]